MAPRAAFLTRRGPRLAVAGLAAAALAGGLWWSTQGASSSAPSAAPSAAATSPAPSAAATSPAPSAAATPAPTPAKPAPSAAATPAPSAAAKPAPAATGIVPDQKPVPPRKEVVLPPVGLAEKADFGNKVTARLTTSERVDGTGQGVGERSGPSLLVTVEITNSSAAAIDLDYIVVNLYGPDDEPGQLLLGDGRSEPMSGKLAPKESGAGTYVLRLPDPTPDAVTVTVNYGAETPTAVFTGKVST